MLDPYLKKLDSSLRGLESIPLYGSAPPFPFEAYCRALESVFDTTTFDIKIEKTDLYENTLDGMGNNPFIRPLVLSPLPELFFLVLPFTSFFPACAFPCGITEINVCITWNNPWNLCPTRSTLVTMSSQH